MRGGARWDPEIERNLRRCDILLLLISPNSTASDYIVNKEIEIVRERQARKEDVVLFPLLLTPTPRAGLDLVRQFNMRPGSDKTLSSYPSSERDSHMARAADEIAEIAKEIAARKKVTPVSSCDPSSTTKPALSNVSISLPLYFLGRDDELAAIDALFNNGKGRSRTVALYGLRGVGKSTLAAAYVERYKADYRATWWLRAQTLETMLADFVGLAMQLGWVAADENEELALDKVRSALREDGEGILLVFDNAIDAASLQPYLLAGGSSRALVTSNSPAWRGVATVLEIRFGLSRSARTTWSRAPDAQTSARKLRPFRRRWAAYRSRTSRRALCDRPVLSLAEYRKRFAASPALFARYDLRTHPATITGGPDCCEGVRPRH